MVSERAPEEQREQGGKEERRRMDEVGMGHESDFC